MNIYEVPVKVGAGEVQIYLVEAGSMSAARRHVVDKVIGTVRKCDAARALELSEAGIKRERAQEGEGG